MRAMCDSIRAEDGVDRCPLGKEKKKIVNIKTMLTRSLRGHNITRADITIIM